MKEMTMQEHLEELRTTHSSHRAGSQYEKEKVKMSLLQNLSLDFLVNLKISKVTLKNVLENYQKLDPAIRVRRAIEFLMSNSKVQGF